MANADSGGMGWVKTLALVLLVAQNASLVLTMRKARTDEGDKFFNTAAVFLCEILKILASSLILLISNHKCNLTSFFNEISSEIFGRPWDTLKVAVPSFIYTVQNNLLYLAVSNLPAATFQVSYQLKILTTALFSVALLNKQLSRTQWLSMLLLFLGVAIVQSHETSESSVDPASQNRLVGFSAVIISCLFSGFAGVYLEKILKSGHVSIWLRNIQLSMFASILAACGMAAKDGREIAEKGIFFGFNGIAFAVVLNQAFGGLLIAVVIKYADNIVKGFATSIAIIVSTVMSVVFFGFQIQTSFVVGAALVISAVYLYSLPAPKAVILPTSLPPSRKI